MFNPSPYRHSVWIDVFGVVLFGAVLLGGAGYLLYHAGGVANSVGDGNAVVPDGRGALPPQPRPSRLARRPILSLGPNPLFGGGGATPPGGSGVEAPFSESWQKQATPNLTGPFGSAPSSGGGPDVGDAAPEPSGPTIASRRPSGGVGGGTVQAGEGNAGSGWRAEARRFSGRARALSTQLGQMTRSSSEEEAESSREDSPATASASRTSSSASSGPGTPSDPSQVPIGGLEWLAAAGAAYALRRLRVETGEE